MRCKDAEKLFSALFEGELSAEEEDRLRAHLAECPKDREQYRAFEATVELLRALPREQAPVGFTADVMRSVRAARSAGHAAHPVNARARRPRLLEWPRLEWPQVAVAAATLVLGVGSGVVVSRVLHSSGGTSLSAETVAPEPASFVDVTSSVSSDSGTVPLPVWEQFERTPIQQVTSGNERATIIF